MNLETIERLTKVHTTLVENYTTICSSNKAYGGYGSTTAAIKASEDIASKISLELGANKEDI
jgi:hypothetical protein